MRLYPDKQESIQIKHPTTSAFGIQVVPTKSGFRVENLAMLPITVDYAGKQYLSKHIHFFDKTAPNAEDLHGKTYCLGGPVPPENEKNEGWSKRLRKFAEELGERKRYLEKEKDKLRVLVQQNVALKESLELQSQTHDVREPDLDNEESNKDWAKRLGKFENELGERKRYLKNKQDKIQALVQQNDRWSGALDEKTQRLDKREANLKSDEQAWETHREIQQSLMDERAKELMAREKLINLAEARVRGQEIFSRLDHPKDLFVFKTGDNNKFCFSRKYLDHIVRHKP